SGDRRDLVAAPGAQHRVRLGADRPRRDGDRAPDRDAGGTAAREGRGPAVHRPEEEDTGHLTGRGRNMDERSMYIDGDWVEALSGARFDVVDPATGKSIAAVPDAEGPDVEAAVGAARRAFDGGPWSAVTERERGRLLIRVSELIRRDLERLAELEVLDCGKPLGEAREDIEESAFMFEYYGGWATKIHGDIPPVGPDAMSLVVKEPA